MNSGYITFQDQSGLVHDLNYTNAYAFGTDLIRWNMAGGKPYAGLFYRRLEKPMYTIITIIRQ